MARDGLLSRADESGTATPLAVPAFGWPPTPSVHARPAPDTGQAGVMKPVTVLNIRDAGAECYVSLATPPGPDMRDSVRLDRLPHL